MADFANVDEYIARQPQEVQDILQKTRASIKAAAPEAEEVISWNMPGYKQGGKILVYFAANKQHLGFYPGGGAAIEAFAEQLKGYSTDKGTIRFPYKKPIPYDLIADIVRYKLGAPSPKGCFFTSGDA